jgi:geranylgeranyl transferase type-2 subunit beta
MSAPYLLRLADRLARGLQRLEPERRERHRRFLLSKQTADGGFADREGGSDLYYTGFAVRGLAILGEIPADVCERLGKYLAQNSRRSLTVIDLVSWLYSSLVVQSASGIDVLSDALPDWPTRLAGILESFRTADGGYAKTHEGAAGSTYHSFLVALCYELIGQPLPEKNRLVQFIYDRQGDDGGFVEIRQMKRSGTNPTAAAVALLRMCDALDDEIRADVCEFLREVRSGEGGFQANTRIPFADGLSTFTGLLTAQDLGATDLIAPAQIERFVGSLEQPGGGFLGAAWDQQADVEYSFYGLGGLGLLWSEDAS